MTPVYRGRILIQKLDVPRAAGLPHALSKGRMNPVSFDHPGGLQSGRAASPDDFS